MDYGKIEIEKIGDVSLYVNYILTADWLYSEDEKEVFKKAYEDNHKWHIECFEEKATRTKKIPRQSFAKEYVKEHTPLDLFSKGVYEAYLNDSAHADYGRIEPASLGRFCGKLQALIYLHDIATEPDVPSGEKILWNGGEKELVTMFYDMLEDARLIKCGKTRLYRLISQNFTDNTGKDISYSYVEKLFKPSNAHERSPNKVDFSKIQVKRK